MKKYQVSFWLNSNLVYSLIVLASNVVEARILARATSGLTDPDYELMVRAA